jgi:hypothetical protein
VSLDELSGEVEVFVVGRDGSVFNFYPEGKSPLRGLVRKADISRREKIFVFFKLLLAHSDTEPTQMKILWC